MTCCSQVQVSCFDFKGRTSIKLIVGRTADTIVSWLEKKTGPPALALVSVEEATAFVAGKIYQLGRFIGSYIAHLSRVTVLALCLYPLPCD